MAKFLGEAEIAPCPPAETLAAFVDRGLSLEERNRVIEHLARCAACRSVLAETVRTIEEIAACLTDTHKQNGMH